MRRQVLNRIHETDCMVDSDKSQEERIKQRSGVLRIKHEGRT